MHDSLDYHSAGPIPWLLMMVLMMVLLSIAWYTVIASASVGDDLGQDQFGRRGHNANPRIHRIDGTADEGLTWDGGE
jgi:hypothetical protein